MQNTLILAIGQAVCGIPRNTEDCHEQHLPDGAKARIGKGFTIGSIKFSDDGKLTVIPCSIGIWMYDTKTGKPLNLLTGYTSWVRSVAFSPDGSLLALASVGDDGTVRTWDVHSGTLLFTLFDNYSLVFSIAFSPDGKTLAGLGVLGTVYLWNVGSGELMWTIEVHQEESYTIAFSPDGKTLASRSKDGIVLLWDLTTDNVD